MCVIIGWFLLLLPICTQVIEAFLLCVIFIVATSGPPWDIRALALGSSQDQCTRGPSSGTTLNTVRFNPLDIYLLHVLSTRYVGITYHWVLQTSGLRLGWLQGSTWNGM